MIWSGRIYSDGYQYLNAHGFSWSTTVSSYDYSYRLNMGTSGSMSPQSDGHKLIGLPIRCLALLNSLIVELKPLARKQVWATASRSARLHWSHLYWKGG